MAPVRTTYAWLGARWTLFTQRDLKEWRERGEGPVSYIAVVLLIALIAFSISQTKLGGTITGYIKDAVDKVWANGTKEPPK